MRPLQKTMIAIAALALAAGPAFAQTPSTAKPETQKPAPPATQKPAEPAAPAAAAPAPRPFPEGAKIAYIDLQRIAQASAEGKAAATKIQEYEKKKLGEIQEKNKALEDMRKMLEQGGCVLCE